MKNSNKDNKTPNTPRIIESEDMAENDFMIFDIVTGHAVLFRDGKIIRRVFSKAEIEKAKQTYVVEDTP